MSVPTHALASGRRWRTVAAVMVALLVVAALGALLWRGATRGWLPSDGQRAQYVASLESSVLPVLGDLQVEYFMDEHECATLTYGRGDFIDGDPRDCGGSTDDPAPFDDTARVDHARVAAALDASDTPIERTGASFRARSLRSAWFLSHHGAPFATAWELLYDPNDIHQKTPSDQVTYTPVPGHDDWWFACCSD